MKFTASEGNDVIVGSLIRYLDTNGKKQIGVVAGIQGREVLVTPWVSEPSTPSAPKRRIKVRKKEVGHGG